MTDKMIITSEIIKLLATQKELFSQVEEITNQMLFSPADELSDLIAARGNLLQGAVKTEEELRVTVSNDESLLETIRCRCDVSNLTEELAGIFEAALRVRAAINRISKLDADVLNRVKSERDMALEQIEALNGSSNSIAANYKQAVQTGFPQNLFHGTTRKA